MTGREHSAREHWWAEDKLLPRVDVLAANFAPEDTVLPVLHPEWFQVNDVVRVGENAPYMTVDEDGNEVRKVWNEAVRVEEILDGGLAVRRAIGANVRRGVTMGERVFIVGNVAPVEVSYTHVVSADLTVGESATEGEGK